MLGYYISSSDLKISAIMKTIKNILFLILILSVSVACKKKANDPEPTLLEQRLVELINGGVSWEVSSVTKDGYNVTGQFTGFVLTIGEFTYSTENALAKAWPKSGTWSFYNDDPNTVLRDDGVIINVNINGSSLVLTYSVTNLGGRVDGINGDYQFNLVSQ